MKEENRQHLSYHFVREGSFSTNEYRIAYIVIIILIINLMKQESCQSNDRIDLDIHAKNYPNERVGL